MSFAESFTYNARSLEVRPAKKEVGIGSFKEEEEEERELLKGRTLRAFSDTNGSGGVSDPAHCRTLRAFSDTKGSEELSEPVENSVSSGRQGCFFCSKCTLKKIDPKLAEKGLNRLKLQFCLEI